MQDRRTFLASAIAVAGSGLMPRLAGAQGQPTGQWPARTVSLVVPWPPGGPVETFCRPIAERLTATLGQTMLIDARPGANGTIGAAHVARSAPDGYTVLAASPGPVLIGPAAKEGDAYDPLATYTPITQIVSSPSVLVVRPDLPFKTLADVIAYAKANPGKLNYGSVGVGSINDLSAASFAQKAGINFLRVPYQGAAPVMTDMLGGRLDMTSVAVAVALPHIKSGKMRPIGVTNMKRARPLPDVPTFSETIPGFQSDNWYGIVGPAGMPAALVERIHAAFAAAVNTPEITAQLIGRGFEPAISASPQAFAEMIRADLQIWKDAIKAAGFKPQ